MKTFRGRVALRSGVNARSGFTLVEVLAALAVLGIGTGIFASLFIASMNLGHLNQSRSVAATLAEEQLALLRNYPEGFAWPNFAAISPGEFAPVTPADPAGVASSATEAPSVMPFDIAAFRRDQNFYDQFSSETFARVPSSGSGHVEIAAVIRWTEKGKPQSVTLTSALARRLVEGRP